MSTASLNTNINSHLALLRQRLKEWGIDEADLGSRSKKQILQTLVPQGPEDSHIEKSLSEALTQLGKFTPGQLAEEIRRLDESSENIFTAKEELKITEEKKTRKLNGNLTNTEELAQVFGIDKLLDTKDREVLFGGMVGLFKYFNPKQKSRVAKIINEVGKRENILESRDLEMGLYREVLDICLTYKLPKAFNNRPQEVQNLRNKLTRHCHDVFSLCNKLHEIIYVKEVKPKTAENYINEVNPHEIAQPNPHKSNERYFSEDFGNYIEAVKNTNPAAAYTKETIPTYDPASEISTLKLSPSHINSSEHTSLFILSEVIEINTENMMSKGVLSTVLGPKYGKNPEGFIELFKGFTIEERSEIASILELRRQTMITDNSSDDKELWRTTHALQTRLIDFTVSKIPNLSPEQSDGLKDTLWDYNPNLLDTIEVLHKINENKLMSFEDIITTAKGELTASEKDFQWDRFIDDVLKEELTGKSLDKASSAGLIDSHTIAQVLELDTNQTKQFLELWDEFLPDQQIKCHEILKASVESFNATDSVPIELTHKMFEHLLNSVISNLSKEVPEEIRSKLINEMRSSNETISSLIKDLTKLKNGEAIKSNIDIPPTSERSKEAKQITSNRQETVTVAQGQETSRENEPSPILSMAIGGVATLGGLLWGRFSGFGWKNILTSLFGLFTLGSGAFEAFSAKK